jgi:hypothetical protein
MTIQIEPGPPAEPRDRASAIEHHRVVAEELPRVRAAALAWRNGVAGLLAGLLGFSLIRGRSDVTALKQPYAAVVGVLLLLALVLGGVAAFLLLRAAHGRPAAVALRHADGSGSTVIGLDHAETLSAVRALRAGLTLALVAAGLLCAAVATTWYGPVTSSKPQLDVLLPGGAVCGTVVAVVRGSLTLDTKHGRVQVPLDQALSLHPVTKCT